MKNKIWIFTFIAGILLGSLIAWTLFAREKVTPAPALDPALIDQLQSKLDSTENKLASEMARSVHLENKITQLQSQLTDLQHTPPPANTSFLSPPAPNFTPDPSSQQSRSEENRQRRITNRAQRELDQITRLIPLSGERLSSVEQLLEQRNRDIVESRRAQARGETYQSPSGFNFEAELAQVLSPDEYQTYTEYEEKVTSARVETVATAQLNRIAPVLNLSESQENEIYSLFYYNAYSQIKGEANSSNVDAQLSNILTPEQLDAFNSMNNKDSLLPDRRFPPQN